MCPDHYNDDQQQFYLDELAELISSGDTKNITEDHIQALNAEVENTES